MELFFTLLAFVGVLVYFCYRQATKYENKNKNLYLNFKEYARGDSELESILSRVECLAFHDREYREKFYMELGDVGDSFNIWREMR